MTNDYTPLTTAEAHAKVDEILAAVGVAFSARLIGETKRADWVCDEWRITFHAACVIGLRGVGFKIEMPYYTGTGHRVDTAMTKLTRVQLKNVSRNSLAWHDMLKGMKPKAPHAASVLHGMILDSSASEQSFADWCSDYGYDTDSRTALATYEDCQKEGAKLHQLFTRDQIAALRNTLQDY